MPEAAIDEHRESSTWKEEVGCTRQAAPILAETDATRA
jgi:hypothetical protein